MKLFKLFILSIALSAFASCNNGCTTQIKRTEADAARKAVKKQKDPTLMVVLKSTKGDSVVVTDCETKDMYTLSVSQLMENKENHGSLTQDNKYAVMADFDNKTISTLINITELTGVWLLDDKSGSGIRLDENGSASNIGIIDDITFRSWRMQKGQLMLTYILSDGSNYDEHEEAATIVELSSGKLVFEYRSHRYSFVK